MDDRRMAIEFRRHPNKWLNFVHFWVVVGRNFVRNRCILRASALAYTTILALIPLLAVMVIVSTSLLKKDGDKHMDQMIDQFIASVAPQLDAGKKKEAGNAREKAVAAAADTSTATPNEASDTTAPTIPPANQDAPPTTTPLAAPSTVQTDDTEGGRDAVAGHIKGFIKNVDGGTLGAFAIIAMILVAISLLSTIEKTFNDIWGVTRARNFPTGFMRYWSTITLGPLCLMFVFALTSGARFAATRQALEGMPLLGSLITGLMPFLILSLLFALFYIAVPNTKVEWPAALVGGAVGGCLWQLNHLCSVLYASKVVTTNKIYGSLSMFPLLLIGLFTSWLILLFGAQVAYSFQNRRTYMQEIQSENVDQESKEFIALRLMTWIGQLFKAAEKPPTLQQIADRLDVPSRLTGRVLTALKEADLIMEVNGHAIGHAPTRPIDQISALDILRALRSQGGDDMATRDEPQRDVVKSEFDRIHQAEIDAAKDTTLAQLVSQADQRALVVKLK
jgi:membrane protein